MIEFGHPRLDHAEGISFRKKTSIGHRTDIPLLGKLRGSPTRFLARVGQTAYAMGFSDLAPFLGDFLLSRVVADEDVEHDLLVY
jgi:hypothetical protein